MGDVVRDLARAKAEREDLEWEGFKLTNSDIGMWAADFGDCVARLRHLTDAHLAQALVEEADPQTAVLASIGRFNSVISESLFFSEGIPNFLLLVFF